jgi:hypothetical protein
MTRDKFKEDVPRTRQYAPERWVLLRNYQIKMLHEEVEPFSNMLQQKYPDGIFLSPRAYEHRERKYPSSVQTYPSLLAAGASDKRTNAFFRVPWPEDDGLPDPIRLLGFYERPLIPDPSLFRRIGRRIEISWPWEGSKLKPTRTATARVKSDDEKSGGEIEIMNTRLIIRVTFDSRDPDIVQFLNEIEQMLIDMTTSEYATYDMYTGALINAKRRRESQRYSAGVIRHAALHDRTYLDVYFKRDQVPQLIGVRPELRASIRAEAGLPIE